jgi:hypothetical protein
VDLDEAARVVEAEGVERLLDDVPRGRAHRLAGTIVGPDPRGLDAFSTAAAARERPIRPEQAMFHWAGVPLALWRELGGFDEDMVGYGYDDMEFGIRLARHGAKALLVSDAFAVHVWHGKRDWAEQSLENERHLDYVLRKHGLDATSDEWADWSVWWHYHADREGRVVQANGRLWAVDRGGRAKLELPSEEWVARLGHRLEDVQTLEPGRLAGLREVGVATDLSVDRR